MIVKLFKTLMILDVIINFKFCQANPESAISQVRIARFETASPRTNFISSTDNFAAINEQESGQSKILADLTRSFNRKQDKPLHIDISQETSVPKTYAFAYAIRDLDNGDDYSHSQAHNGKATKGEYRVKLPDGRVQVVTYTADDGGYRANIRYDQIDTNVLTQATDTDGAYNFYSNEKVSPSISPLSSTNNLERNTNPLPEGSYKKESPLRYFNEIRSFGVTTTGKPAASYETFEHVDEEQFPYDKKLIDDVNYLLQYISPTVETKTENVLDVIPNKVFYKQPRKFEQSDKKSFELPFDFPFKFDEKKLARLLEKQNYQFPEFSTPNTPAFPATQSASPHFSSTSRYEKPQNTFSQAYDDRRPPQFLSTPKDELQFVTPHNHTSSEQSKFNRSRYHQGTLPFITPKYVSNESPLFNTNTETWSIPLPQPEHRQPTLYTPNYDSSDQLFRSSQLNVPRHQIDDKSIFASHIRNSGQYPNSQEKTEAYLQQEIVEHDSLETESPAFVPTNSQEQRPVAPGSTYNYQGHPPMVPVPAYNSAEEYPQVSPISPNDYNAVTPTIPLFGPTVPVLDHSESPRNQLGKIEIPQYLHIHRYESGEDGKPKELIYYTPLQIPIPNSIAYIERGYYNSSPPYKTQPVSYTPHYVTMIQHPHQNINTSNVSSHQRDVAYPAFRTIDNSKYNRANYETPDYPDTAIPSTASQRNIIGSQNMEYSIEQRDPNSQYFDPRTYSGYFDFSLSAEMKEENPKDEYHNSSSSPKQGLPQYYYEYATATPTHRYISSEAMTNSRESDGARQDDRTKNSSFLASAYLKPLHKERVYIHHNSLPTPTPASLSLEERLSSFATTNRPMLSKTGADVSIVKSISSSILPQLLKDFHYQLSNTNTRADREHGGSEVKNARVTTLSSSTATTTTPTTSGVPKLNKAVVRKLQPALSTNGNVYLKPLSNTVPQKQTVR